MWASGYEYPESPEEIDLLRNTTKLLVLGGLFPLSGRLRTGGVEREAGARFAVETINKEQLLLPGYTLKLVTFDTKTDEKETTRLALRLCDEYKVLGLVGEAASANSQAAALIADIYDTAQISYASTSVLLSNKDRYPTFFRTPPSDSFQGLCCRRAIRS